MWRRMARVTPRPAVLVAADQLVMPVQRIIEPLLRGPFLRQLILDTKIDGGVAAHSPQVKANEVCG